MIEGENLQGVIKKLSKRQLSKLSVLLKGGQGSGNFGHSGIPGQVGGSGSGGGGSGSGSVESAYRLAVNAKESLESGKPLFKGEWEASKTSGEYITTKHGTEYVLSFRQGTEYKQMRTGIRDPAKTKYYRSLELTVGHRDGKFYTDSHRLYLKFVSAKGEGASGGKLQRAEATISQWSAEKFGISNPIFGFSFSKEAKWGVAMIEQRGNKWVIVSEKDPSKVLGEFDTEEEAKKRLKQIEAFKGMGKAKIEKLKKALNK